MHAVSVSTDVVLFSIRNDRLEVLLVRRPDGLWGIPGGLARMDEELEASALRQLGEQAGVHGVYLEQLYTFGSPDRDPEGRVISVAYYALVSSERLHIRPRAGSLGLGWFATGGLPTTALDHDRIVALAHRRLASKLEYSTIALQFMPEQFTLGNLQRVYETIMGGRLDKRNFRKRLLALDCIEDTGEVSREGSHRPARLYRVRAPGRVSIVK